MGCVRRYVGVGVCIMYIKCRITHTLLAIPLLKEHTYHRLWIDPERHLLDLYGFEQLRRLSLCLLGRLLLLLSLGLLLPLPFLLGGAGARGLALQSLYVFLCLATLLVLHAERLVRHDLCGGRLSLFVLVLWRHVAMLCGIWDRVQMGEGRVVGGKGGVSTAVGVRMGLKMSR